MYPYAVQYIFGKQYCRSFVNHYIFPCILLKGNKRGIISETMYFDYTRIIHIQNVVGKYKHAYCNEISFVLFFFSFGLSLVVVDDDSKLIETVP